jgi:hypothetical protein
MFRFSSRLQPHGQNRLQGLLERSQPVPAQQESKALPPNRLNGLMQDNFYGSPVSEQPYGQNAAYGPMVINPNYNGIPDEYKSPFYPQPSGQAHVESHTASPAENPHSSGNSLEKLLKTGLLGASAQVNRNPIVKIAKKEPVYKAVKKIGKKLGF